VIDELRLVVCVGTGGVGKTTVSAALALAAAQRGRRAMVLTIDPARALARALGVDTLGPDPQRIAIAGPGILDAGMLDTKLAWDGFVTRHAPNTATAADVLANPFYRKLSSAFAGSTEFVAIEELCRLAESGDYDVIVLDTPPATHALDFLRAPERIDRLFETDVARWLALGRGAWRSAGAGARFVLRRLEHATGKRTLHDIATFFAAFQTLVEAALERSHRARALLRDPATGFVLVTGPRQLVVDETIALAAQLRVHLAAIALNRVHPLPVTATVADAAWSRLGDVPGAAWLRDRWDDAVAETAVESGHATRLRTSLPGIPIVSIPEAEHDPSSLEDLGRIARDLERLSAS